MSTQLCRQAFRTRPSRWASKLARKRLSAFSTSHPTRTPNSYVESSTPSPLDDLNIAPFFDHPRRALPTFSSTSSSGFNAGLFGQPELSSPQDLLHLAGRTVTRARLLVQRITQSRSSFGEMRKVVKNIDRLSDMLCGVIDAAELIRHSHPEEQWLEAANQAYEGLCSYMNTLNTNVELYQVSIFFFLLLTRTDVTQVLREVMDNPSISGDFTYEQKQTALIFLRDFEKSGIHLPADKRNTFVTLSDNIIQLGREFQSPTSAGLAIPVQIRTFDLDGLPSRIRQHISRQASYGGKIKIRPGSWEALMISKHTTNEDLRRQLYISDNRPHQRKIEALENLLKSRHQLAELVGKQSYSEWTLEDKMAKSTSTS